MAKLIKSCPSCDVPLEAIEGGVCVLSETEELITYRCGHAFVRVKALAGQKGFPTSSWTDSQEAYPFQVEGVEHGIASDYNHLIGDQMGLGKTVQALLEHRSEYKALSPALYIVPSATAWQWTRMYKKWCDPLPLGVFLIQGSKGFVPPGFSAYIMSMDTLRSAGSYNPKADKFLFSTRLGQSLRDISPKLVVVDEIHSFKNPESKRSQALVAFIKELGIEHKVFLSGTPIKNRAQEYFVPLNLLKPDLFPSLAHFKRNWLTQDASGKWSRIKEWRQEEFRQFIKPFVIRRERNEVLKDLPTFKRTFTEITIEDETMKALYNQELDRLREKSESDRAYTYFDISDNLMTLRRITGIAKVPWVCEYVEEFLGETEDEKIAIGVHHHAVRDGLSYRLGATLPNGSLLRLSGEDNPERKQRMVQDFAKPQNRVAVISMLAGGTGLDGLQVCNNVVTVERQWSAADEEQFEDRFNRPGQTRPVTAEYIQAKGTIDTYFSELVSQKRRIFGETIGNQWSLTDDKASLNDLVEWTVGHRL